MRARAAAPWALLLVALGVGAAVFRGFETSATPGASPPVPAPHVEAVSTRAALEGSWGPDAVARDNGDAWLDFEPPPDDFEPAELDLRPWNEKRAGDFGTVGTAAGALTTGPLGLPWRFWGVNAGQRVLDLDDEQMHVFAGTLAKRGVNLVRLHVQYWLDKDITRVEREAGRADASSGSRARRRGYPYGALDLLSVLDAGARQGLSRLRRRGAGVRPHLHGRAVQNHLSRLVASAAHPPEPLDRATARRRSGPCLRRARQRGLDAVLDLRPIRSPAGNADARARARLRAVRRQPLWQRGSGLGSLGRRPRAGRRPKGRPCGSAESAHHRPCHHGAHTRYG